LALPGRELDSVNEATTSATRAIPFCSTKHSELIELYHSSGSPET
jgi:hypothetical protein